MGCRVREIGKGKNNSVRPKGLFGLYETQKQDPKSKISKKAFGNGRALAKARYSWRFIEVDPVEQADVQSFFGRLQEEV